MRGLPARELENHTATPPVYRHAAGAARKCERAAIGFVQKLPDDVQNVVSEGEQLEHGSDQRAAGREVGDSTTQCWMIE